MNLPQATSLLCYDIPAIIRFAIASSRASAGRPQWTGSYLVLCVYARNMNSPLKDAQRTLLRILYTCLIELNRRKLQS